MATVASASAQMVEHPNNLQFNLGGGIHTLLYSPAQGNRNLGFGGLFEAQYQYMFNQHFGISAGLQASTSATNSVYNYQIQETNILLPGAVYRADVSTRLYNWRERQRFFNATVPVQLLFRAPINVRYALQVGLGASFNFPFRGQYAVTEGVTKREAYMPETNVTYSDMPNHLLGNDRGGQTGTLDLKPVNVGILADLGMVVNLRKSCGLYLGLYADYSPANVNLAADQAAPLLQYNAATQQYDYTGTFASDRVQKASPLMVGIKVGLRLGVGHDFGWAEREAAALAAAEQAKADSLAAVEAARAARLAAEQQARDEELARTKAEAESRARAQADSIAAVHAAELAKAKAEAERLAQEKAEAEAKAKAEAERLAKEKAEAEARARAETEAREKAEAEARAKARAEQKAREEVAFIAGFTDTAYFETAQDMPIFGQLNADSWDNLKEIMDSHPEIRVTISGHTDNIGSEASNKALSQRRADNIKKMLVDKGIAESRITAIGKGESHPIASNKTPEGRAKNRCIIITIGK